MRMCCVLFVCLMSIVGCTTHKALTSDDFSDGRIDPHWSMFSNGCSVVESDGVLSIQGTTVVEGWGNGNGLESDHFWPEGSFDVSVDFMAPEFSGRGTKLVYLMAKGSESESVGLFYSYDIGYRVQSWEPRQFSEWLEPFGDERSAYHTMRLVYDADSATLIGYVDDSLVGSLNIQMGGDVSFTLQTASESVDMTIDARFDNFIVKNRADSKNADEK